MFLFYLMWRLRQIDSVTSIIHERIRRDFIDLSNETVLARADLPVTTSLSQWVLFDSTESGPPFGVYPSVLVTSPMYDSCD